MTTLVKEAVERIARIIEPGAWSDFDKKGYDNGRTRRDREWSIERARKILASLPTDDDDTVERSA